MFDNACKFRVHKVFSPSPIVIPAALLWFQKTPTQEDRDWFEQMKKECPLVARRISVSNWPIGGELSSFFIKIKELMYPDNWKNRDRKAVEKWLKEHTEVKPKLLKGGVEKCVSTGSFLPMTNKIRHYIKVRMPRTKGGEFKWMDYMFMSKSLIGCTDIIYSENERAPNDYKYTVMDPQKYAKSGYGLFFDRDFKKYECIGLYCGDIKLKRYLPDTGYNIEWKNKHYVVDGSGPGWPIYFGWHYANAPDTEEGANVMIDDDMFVYPTRDVKKGEEAFFNYGKKRDVIDNLKKPKKKGGKKQGAKRGGKGGRTAKKRKIA